MLHYAVVFFVIALMAAFFGFGGIAVGAAGIAKVLFIVFLIGAIVSFLMSLGPTRLTMHKFRGASYGSPVGHYATFAKSRNTPTRASMTFSTTWTI